MEKRDKEGGVSRSFVTGAVALVFLVIGFQTAIFLHRAAVTRIVAKSEEPDTVYVYVEGRPGDVSRAANGKVGSGAGEGQRWQRAEDGKRKPKAGVETGDENQVKGESQKENIKVKMRENEQKRERVKEQYMKKKVENFRFNPNTASVEELIRLGFSEKQALSIDNYRQKGGRFSRKEDFSKSFVVADSVYRRLEPFIDIPLTNLNIADSAAFDALPGIGPFYAAKIVEYRKQLGGYSRKEQLMNIWKFDKEKFDAIADLIYIDTLSVKAYRLWELPADSLRLHPEIRNWNTANNIVLYRENTPESEWSIERLRKNGILSEQQAAALERCLIASP